MLNQEEKTSNQPIPMDGQLLTADEYQQEMAGRISEEVFETEENAEKTAEVISSFVQSYEKHKNELPLEEWLSAEFKKYPDIWKDEEEIRATALEVITAVTASNQKKTSLQTHLDQGKSKETWLAKEIEKGATVSGAANVGAYADGIERAIEQSNLNNWDVITRKDGGISNSFHLDGFIAEHHHANTFNMDAAAKGSAYRAKVLEPEGGYGKNSMDIGIYDAEGKLVRRYQSKYGADAESTHELFDKGDYRGQRKLVPEGHGNSKSTEVIEIDGISSKPLSKEAAKELQNKAQQKYEAKQYEWNDINRITIAKQIGKQALMGACITAGIHGSRILARRVWNSITGKTNPAASEDMKEFFESSIKSSAHVGIQVAVSGGVVVAVKNGWLGKFLKNTPAGRIATIAYIGMENAKVLFKLSKCELTKEEALDAMGQTTTTAIAAIMGAAEGAALGASLGAVFGPLGIIAGGFLGGVVGGMAGSAIGEAVYEGGKAIVKTAYDTVKVVGKSIYEGAKNVVSGLASAGTRLLSSIFG
jgi:hypothetical protein